MLTSHYFPHGSQVVETLQSNPETFRTWFAIAFSAKETSRRASILLPSISQLTSIIIVVETVGLVRSTQHPSG